MSVRIRMLTKDEVIAIHAAPLERFGGLLGVRDEGLLRMRSTSSRDSEG